MRQEERRARTFAALVEAAAAAFARSGYDGVSLDAIATAAGLSKGAVYTHFQTKLDLFLTVTSATLADATHRNARVARAMLRDDVRTAALAYLGDPSDPDHVALMAEIWRMAAEPTVRAMLESFRRDRHTVLSQAGIDAGDRPAEALARAEMVAKLIDAETLERRLLFAAGA